MTEGLRLPLLAMTLAEVRRITITYHDVTKHG